MVLHEAYAKISKCNSGPVVLEKKEDENASLPRDGWPTDNARVRPKNI